MQTSPKPNAVWTRRGALIAICATAVGFASGARAQPGGPAHAARAFLASGIGSPAAERRAKAEALLDSLEAEKAPETASRLLLEAAAIGMAARASSFKASLAAGYADRGRAILDALARREPKNPWALAMSGMWHFEVIRRGGVLGGALKGARLSRGKAELEEAVRIAGGADPAIPFAFAVMLLSEDPEAHGRQARAMLERTRTLLAAGTDGDPDAEKLRGPTTAMLRALEKGKLDKAQRLALAVL